MKKLTIKIIQSCLPNSTENSSFGFVASYAEGESVKSQCHNLDFHDLAAFYSEFPTEKSLLERVGQLLLIHPDDQFVEIIGYASDHKKMISEFSVHVFLEVLSIVDDKEIHPDDVNLPGFYHILVEGLTNPGDIIGAAKDAFHLEYGIKVMEDFEFRYQIEAYERDGYEPGTYDGSATVLC